MNRNRVGKVKKIYINIIICVCVVSIILTTLFSLCKFNFIQRPQGNDFYFNMITLNSIIAGFAFTNIGLLLSAASTEVVRRICKTDIMKRKNDKLMASVAYSVATMFICMPYVMDMGVYVGKVFPVVLIDIIADGMYLSMIILLILGIAYFVKSITEISNLLDEVYKNKSKLTEEKIEDINKELKKGVNQ